MMGGQSSKNVNKASPPPPPPPPPPPTTKAPTPVPIPPLDSDTKLQYLTDLSSYEAACKHDPKLQRFDASLQQRTTRVVNSLATGAEGVEGIEVRSLSFDSLKEVTDCLLDMNQEVVKVILECKKDIWNNQGMFSLVEQYFENSLQTLDFCTALEKCLKRAVNNQLIIKAAVSQFEEELQNGVDGEKYVKTLQELAKFKDAGDPFTEEFFALFQSVYGQQMSMLKALQLRKRKLDKKLKSLKTWRTVSNVVFVATFVSVLIFSVVAAAIAAPPVITALAGAMAVPVGSMGKWCNWLWNRYGNALKGQRELLSSIQIGTYITLKDLDNIRVLVSKLEVEIDSLLRSADFALTQEDAVKVVIDDIKKRLGVFVETIESLSEHADKCSRDVIRARTVILQRIIKHPGS